jgi:phosphotriesterase-related protein
MTHTPPGAAAQQLEILIEEGADPRRIAVGHADARLDLDYHREIVAAGAFLSFDLIGLRHFPDEWRARHVAELVRQGLADHVLLSMDICQRSRLKTWGGHGYDYLISRFLPLLEEEGVDAETITHIVVANPRRFLAG